MDKVLSYIGLAQRGRKLASGEFSAEKAIKEGKAYLVVIAEDASDNTRKHFHDMCSYREIPFLDLGSDKSQLGHSMGKELRACAAVLDEGLAKAILKAEEDKMKA